MKGRPPKRLLTPYSAFAALVFACLWLAPVAWIGTAGKDVSFMPIYLKHVQRCACLFPKAVRSWKTHHIEILVEGERPWKELQLDGYFDMGIFGYRTRMGRILGRAYRSKRRRKTVSREIAKFLKKRYAELNPDGPRLRAVRFVRLRHKVKDLIKEKGHFRKPLLKNAGKRPRQTFGKVVF